MDVYTFQADDDDDEDDELILESDSDSDQPAHKFPAAKRPRLGLLGSRQISLLDDFDTLDTQKTEKPQLTDEGEAFRCRPDSKLQEEQEAPVQKASSARRAQARRLDPALQAEALRAKANLDRIRREAAELAAASASEDDEVEVVITSTATDAAKEDALDEEKVMLRIKSAKDHEGQKMRIGVRQPLSRLFEAYQQTGHKAGWLDPDAAVIFKWDGEKLRGSETAASLDLEEDDVIDAVW